jgi:NADH dehydrogenase [ubiquinone] 1 alpha subcomplex assembly factor 5
MEPMPPIPLFDRALVRLHRRRAAADLSRHGFLLERAAQDLAERLEQIERRFEPVLLHGPHSDFLLNAISARSGACARLERIISMDGRAGSICADEEALPFAAGTFGAVISLMSLHWVNDLPGTLIQIRRTLKPDGLLLAAFFGGDTLDELRTALAEAEIEIDQGMSPRISPFVDIRDGAALLQRAGFALPVADRDRVQVSYPSALHLMAELRGMGEANALIERRRVPLKRAVLARANEIYGARFPAGGGRIAATFDVVALTGWAPHEDQQRPLAPGSAKMRLADALGTVEGSMKP